MIINNIESEEQMQIATGNYLFHLTFINLLFFRFKIRSNDGSEILNLETDNSAELLV